MGNIFKIKRFTSILVFTLGLVSTIQSQDQNSTSTPQATIMNHLRFMNGKQYNPEKAAASFHPSFGIEVRIEHAEKLQRIYDGYGLTFVNIAIPKLANWVDTVSGKNEFIPFPSKFPEINVRKFGEHWYYSIETSEFIEKTYQKIFPAWADELIQYFPSVAHKKILGIAIWQYISLLIILCFLTVFHFFLSWAVNRILNKSIWESLNITKQNHKVLFKLSKILSINILVIILKKLLPVLALNSSFTAALITAIDIIQTFLIAWGAFQLIIILKLYLMVLAEKTATKMDDQLIPLLAKTLKFIIGSIAFIHFLSLFGVNVTALIAGASIGGLAIALAAQDTFKNLFGSVMLFMDKPFTVGDYITTSEIEGTVEHVGFRSTRIRKIDTSVISVPNGNIANVTITNLGIRKFRIVELTVNLVYNTPFEKIESYLIALRALPDKYAAIQDNTWLIYLRYLSPSSVDIYFRVYIEANDMNEELALREKLIFEIMYLAKSIDVAFAYPSSSIYIEQIPNGK